MGEPFSLRWFFPIEGKDMNAIIDDMCTDLVEIEESNHPKKE